MIWQSKADKFDRLLAKYAPELELGFMAGVDDLARRVDIRKLRAALEAGDVSAALRAMNLDEAAFVQFEEAFRKAFVFAGTALVADAPRTQDPEGNEIILRFNGRDRAAEDWLRSHSSALVKGVVAETRQVLRDKMTTSLEAGKNPNKLVTELVGRYNRLTKSREGSLIGLTADQAAFVDNAAAELANGRVKAYFSRELRDRTFDRAIAKAVKAGQPVPPEVVKTALAAYKSRLLAFRAKVVGRTETFTAMSKSEFTAYTQAIANGDVAEASILKFWDDADDKRVRPTHVKLGDDKGVPFSQPFVSASGARMMHPHDRSLGAPASEIIGCRCRVRYKIDFLAGVS